jgi:Ca-activated chloride channel homolog
MLTLATPWSLVLLPAPLLVWYLVPPHRNRVRAIRIPFFRHVTEAAGAEPRAGAVVLRRTRVQMAAAVLVWLLVVLGLAGPERLAPPVVIERAARDIMLALDISGSMDARDIATADGERLQRLEAVKRVIANFISARQGDRIGLIVFGSRAFVQAPFTEDLQSLQGFLDQTVVGMAGPNTALGDAIGLAIRSFQASEVDQRLLILLSDGADTASRVPPVTAAALAAERGVTIHAIGVGDPQGKGENRVDLDALTGIARATGGSFFFADDQAALAKVYARIDEITPHEVETLSFRPRQRLAHLPIGAALLIVLATLAWLRIATGRRAVA